MALLRLQSPLQKHKHKICFVSHSFCEKSSALASVIAVLEGKVYTILTKIII